MTALNKVRVYEVARELGMTNKDLVALFQSLGFNDVRNHMSAVEPEAIERIKRRLERRHEPDRVEERVAATVVKRRRAADAAEGPVSARGEAPAPVSRGDASYPGVRADAPHSARPSAPASVPASSRREAPVSRPRADAPVPPASAPVNGGAVEVRPAAATPAARPSSPASARAGAPAADLAPPEGARVEPVESERETAGAVAAGDDAAEAAPPELAGDLAPPEISLRSDGGAAEPAAEPGEPLMGPGVAGTHVDAPAPSATGRAAAAAAAVVAAAARAPTIARRPSQPPKSGIEVWEGRPGVPMPARPRTPVAGPAARRTTYDPRANVAQARGGYAYGSRMVAGRPMRPGFRRGPPSVQRPGARGKPEVSTKEMSADKRVIKIEGETSLQMLAGKMSLKATDVLLKLLGMGMTGVNINSTLDVDTAKLLAAEFGWTVEDVAVDEASEIEAAMQVEGGEEIGDAEPRPPIVTVMGHVDHGKTTLLDYVRKAQVAASEAGGITQHVGAYRVETKRGTICFLDTPGHEAFTSMRARGASVTDIVVLVVAADDGVMPQTREAIAHARDAEVPILVAINKIDKPGVDADRIMRELASEGLTPEDWGGETIFVKVSARTGTGIDQLLEMILLQAELLELSAHPKRRAQGVVLEALLDRGRGPVARVLVQEGTLQNGDHLLAGVAHGKIRAMVDEKGRKLAKAGPSTPVEVLGLDEVPSAGDPFYAVKDAKAAEALAEERRKKARGSMMPQDTRVSLEALTNKLQEGAQLELKVIIKADVQGSVEALTHALGKLSTERVRLSVVHTGVGGITETDVNLAVAAKAVIIGFNVRPAGKAKQHAEQEKIEIRLYNIIYEAIDDVKSAMEGLLPATKVEKELGKAEVREVFRISKIGTVAGCLVSQGLIKRSAEVRLVRDSVVVWSGRIGSLRRFKDDAREVREGLECGISLDGFQDVKQGDVIETFEIEEIKATL